MLKKTISLISSLVLIAVAPISTAAYSPIDISENYYNDICSEEFTYERLSERRYRGIELHAEPETVSVGEHTQITAWLDGEQLGNELVKWTVAAGGDCGVIDGSGVMLALGSGVITVQGVLYSNSDIIGRLDISVSPSADSSAKEIYVYETDDTFEQSISDFPESYKTALRSLHAKYPEWIFKPFETDIEWTDALECESTSDRSLVQWRNTSDILKSKKIGDFDGTSYDMKDQGWVSTTEPTVAYYLDPRNFLDEKGIFMFEMLSYDENIHTLDGIESILSGSFMADTPAHYLDSDGNPVNEQKTYAEIIMEAAQETGVSPYYLAAKIRLEIGNTPSNSVTGTYEGLEGLYNFYNIGATDGDGAIGRGLQWAADGSSYRRPWTSPELSIKGGADYIAESYIDGGQFTCYLQRFNVNPDSSYKLFYHQYYTNISGTLSQAQSSFDGYEQMNTLSEPKVFSIPVYLDMPNEDGLSSGSIILEGSENTATVTAKTALRTAPSAGGGVVDELDKGDKLRVISAGRTTSASASEKLYRAYWLEVEVEKDGVTEHGYVCENYIEPDITVYLSVGETYSLTITGTAQTPRFFSTKPHVAEVGQNGVVTALCAGSTEIIAYTSDGSLAIAKIAVY